MTKKKATIHGDDYVFSEDKYDPEIGLAVGLWGGLLAWSLLIAMSVSILAICQGCGSYTSTQTGTLGGSYSSRSEWTPFRRTTAESASAPSVEAVESTMLSDAVRLCLAQRERQAELAARRDARRASVQGGGFVAVVPPQHPSSVTDDHAYCMSLAQGQSSGSALGQSVAPVQPTVVQNPWMMWGGYGQQVPFSGTGGAAGVR